MRDFDFDLSPSVRAASDQEIAHIDTAIDEILDALRSKASAVSAEPGVATGMVMSQMRDIPLFHVKALAARALVRLSQTEVR